MKRINNENAVFIDVDETLIIDAAVNEDLVKKIIEWDSKGRPIIVWTSNPLGVEHAERAVYEANIEDYVNYVMVKPITIVDDDHLEYYSIIDPETLKYRSRE